MYVDPSSFVLCGCTCVPLFDPTPANSSAGAYTLFVTLAVFLRTVYRINLMSEGICHTLLNSVAVLQDHVRL